MDGHYFNQRDRAEELLLEPPLDPPLDETHQDQEPQRERAQKNLQEPPLDPTPLDETHQDQEPTSHHTQSIPLHVPRSTNPINEFTSNDENFYGTFPTLFPLGCGLRKPGSIPTADAKHMLNQHSAIFGDSHVIWQEHLEGKRGASLMTCTPFVLLEEYPPNQPSAPPSRALVHSQ